MATRWSAIESNLRVLLYDLAAYNAADYENDETFQVLAVFLSNMDGRQAVANAKALAHSVADPPDFYDRAETLLNWIDNDLRNERNRYIHDRWVSVGPLIHRIKAGTVIRREPSTGERKSQHDTRRQFIGFEELNQFAEKLSDASSQLLALGDELREKLNEIRPMPE